MNAIPPDRMLSVALEAQDWNVVFAALNELPMRVARPVYDRIMGQIQGMVRPNGGDHDFPTVVRDERSALT